MRKDFRLSSTFSLLAGTALLGPALAFAQLGGGFVAPTDALDTLNGASTGPSGAFGSEAIRPRECGGCPQSLRRIPRRVAGTSQEPLQRAG